MSNQVGQQLGNHRLTRLLGQGGLAEVYLAEHIHLKTLAAIKLLHSNLRTKHVQDFVNEAQTIAALSHPSILRILDFGFENALPFLVMDYAPGGTLRDRHPDNSPIPFPVLLPYVKQMAEALAYAHSKKLIHRDVKPENMLIDVHDNILLSDFGIVTVAHSTASMQTVDKIGTVYYMAPEQIKGKPRPASDQYALAAVIYEWLCGEPPFTGDSTIEIAMQHISDDPSSLCHKVPSLPPRVEQVVFKALAKDPLQRFPDILTFANALEQAGTPNQNAAPRIASQPPQHQHRLHPGHTWSPFSPTEVTPIQGKIEKQEQVYEAFRRKIQSEQEYAVYGDILVLTDDGQINQVIYLLSENDWIKYPNQRTAKSSTKHILAKSYAVNGVTFTAGVFKNVPEGEYIVWINEMDFRPILVHAKEATLADLRANAVNPFLSSIRASTQEEIRNREVACGAFQQELQSKQIYAVYGDILVLTDDEQMEQAIHLLSENDWIKYPTKRTAKSSAKHILAKSYTVNGVTFTAGVFKNVSEGEYIVWIDEMNFRPVLVHAKEATLADLRSQNTALPSVQLSLDVHTVGPRCPKCGNSVHPNWRYCRTCGARNP